MHGRGVFACISPWNFPLAIFTGQVAGALAAGNAVLAKPAEPTPLIAAAAVELLHRAGVPEDVLHFIPGEGSRLGEVLFADARLAGVALTGSTEAAWAINRALAARDGPLAQLIAETGGMNAMIVDFDRSARTGHARRDRVGLRQRRPALQRSARVVRAGRCRRPHAGTDSGRDGRAEARRSVPSGHRHRTGDRRIGARTAGGARHAHDARGKAAAQAEARARTRAAAFSSRRMCSKSNPLPC